MGRKKTFFAVMQKLTLSFYRSIYSILLAKCGGGTKVLSLMTQASDRQSLHKNALALDFAHRFVSAG
jgi:hypothetical protein